MYNVGMFRKLKQIYGGTFYTEGTEERVMQLEKELQITLPEDYKFFLRTLGEGGLSMVCLIFMVSMIRKRKEL